MHKRSWWCILSPKRHDARREVVLWPKGQSPPRRHNRRGGSLAEGAGSSPPDMKSKAGAAYANPRLCSAPDPDAAVSFVSLDPPNIGHLTNGWSAHTVLHWLLHELRAVGNRPGSL